MFDENKSVLMGIFKVINGHNCVCVCVSLSVFQL